MRSHVYVYLSSKASTKEHYPDNSASAFTTVLPEALDFQGDWEVALVELSYPGSASKGGTVHILTDIIVDSILGDSKLPVLRRINLASKGKSLVFDTPFYKPLKNNLIQRLTLSIANSKGEKHSFDKGECRCTLHFRKCRR